MLDIIKKHVKGAGIFIITAPLAMVVEVIMDLMQPTLMSEIIDIGVRNGDIAFILDRGKYMLIVALIGVLGGLGCTVLSTAAGTRFGSTLRQSLFDKVQTFSFKEIDRLSTSSLVTRVTNDVTQMQNIVTMGLRMMVRAPISCIGGLVMAYMLSPRLAVIFLIAMPVLFAAVFVVMRKVLPMFGEVQKKVDRVNTVMRENLLGVRVVKAFVGQPREAVRFEKASSDLMNWSLKAGYRMIMMSPLVMLVLNMSVVALFWFGGNMAIAGEIEAGKIMAFLTYLHQALFSLLMVVMMLVGLSRAQASAKRIAEVFDTESSITDPANPMQAEECAVEFEDVSFKYNDSSEYVLKNISFKAADGQTIGIIGPTGSGKSSLVSLIPRFYDANEGSVKIGGVDVRDFSQEDLRQKVGIVLQESVLFSGTVRQNLRWADEACDFAVIEKAAEDAQAAEFILQNPDKFDAVVEQRAKNFSGGQKQRLSIARTFARRPEILILDDSTSAVDTATDSKIRAAIASREDSRIVFIIAQRVSAIMHADMIIVLDDGRISGTGTHEELLANNEIYRTIAVSQMGEEVLENAGKHNAK